MSERFGSWGKLLRVDLTTLRVTTQELAEDFFRRFPGGRTLIGYVLLTEVPKGADPLGPENILVFAPGVLTGTPLSGASRHSVGAKSPLTRGFGEAEVGGFWGAELKKAGWDGIVVTGASATPVYLWIKDEAVEIRDAAHLWGFETAETEEALKQEVGERLARVCEIGPAGEHLVKYAGIVNDYKDIAGRTGMGAVMGSKRLKAIVVRGTRQLPLADKPAVMAVGRWVADTLQENHWAFHNFGTGMGLDGYTKVGGMAVLNYDGGAFANAAEISAEALKEKGYRIKMEACWACSVRCKKVVKLEQPYPVDPKYGGPEYESIAALGADCGVDDLALVCKVNERCNANGLDTISYGAVMAWAMDCRRAGIIADAAVDGEPVVFGSGKALLAGVEAVSRRRGFGDVLAEGVKRAAERLGGAELAIHVRGLEIAMHDPRQRTEYGKSVRVSYMTSPTGGDHLLAHARSRSMKNGVGMCFFLRYDEPRMLEIVNAVTGWGMEMPELMVIGERGLALARLFNLREGFTAAEDALPPKLLKPQVSGPLSKVRLDPDELAAQVRAYYKDLGWSEDEGRPLPETLDRLGIDVAVA